MKKRYGVGLRRFWLAAGLLGLGPWSAAAQDLVVQVEAQPAKIFLTRPLNQEVELLWSLDLGPTRYLMVESSALVISGTRLERPRKMINATGRVRFRDTVSAAELQRFTGRNGELRFSRGFVALSAAGGKVSGEGVAFVALVDPQPTAEMNVGVCSRTVILPWNLNTDADNDLTVAGAMVTSPVLTSSGIGRRRWSGRPIPETVTVSPEAIARALRSGSPISYSRTFDFYFKGELLGQRSGTAEIGVDEFQVKANPDRPLVTVGKEVTIPVTWSALSCQQLSSTAGKLEAGGEILRTTAGATASESLRVPGEVSLRARDLGASEIRYSRSFVDQFGNEKVGELSLRLVGSVAGAFSVRRLALQFEDGKTFRLADRQDSLSALAEITYDGTGLLEAEWEVADPSSTLGKPLFRPLGVVRRHLPAGGRVELRSPVLPTDLVGTYGVRLMISQPSTAFDEPPVLPYQVTGEGEFISRVEPRPPPWDEAPRIKDSDPIMDREIVVFTADMDEARRLDQIGLQTKLRYPLRSLGLVVSVLRVPASASVGALIDELRRRHPTLWIDANHRYKSQQCSVVDIDLLHVAQVEQSIGWGQAQRECPSEFRIGLIDTAIDREVLEDPSGGKHVPEGEKTSTGHGTLTAGLLVGIEGKITGLVPRAKDFLYTEETLSEAQQSKLGESVRYYTNLDRLARAFDQLLKRKPRPKIVNIGVAGQRGLGLYLLVWILRHEEVFLVAPYGDDEEASYPAASEWVFGTAAYDSGQPPNRNQETIFVRQLVDSKGGVCGNSCSASFVTAALWVAMGSSGGVGWEERENILKETTRREGPDSNVFLLRAPPCRLGN